MNILIRLDTFFKKHPFIIVMTDRLSNTEFKQQITCKQQICEFNNTIYCGFKGPCKRTQHCCPTTPSIVGLNNVVTCCVRLQRQLQLRCCCCCCCMEPQQCWHLLALVAYSLKPVKLLGPCKRTQHCWPTTPNNVGSCWHLLCQFAWALKLTTFMQASLQPI